MASKRPSQIELTLELQQAVRDFLSIQGEIERLNQTIKDLEETHSAAQSLLEEAGLDPGMLFALRPMFEGKPPGRVRRATQGAKKAPALDPMSFKSWDAYASAKQEQKIRGRLMSEESWKAKKAAARA